MDQSKHNPKQKQSLLDSNYITELNKAKEENMKASVYDQKRTTMLLQKMQTLYNNKETAKQKRERWKLYMENLIESNHENMKRKMIDLVDSIHKEE